ncbi:MAG: GNAT family N-acetyltransferase [Kibdelosporangium sp.]
MRLDTLTLVRDARPQDATAIGDVHAEAWRMAYRAIFESRFLDSQADVHRRTWTEKTGTDLAESVLVAERGHQVVAFAHFGAATEGDGKGEIFACFARPTAWGTGVAGTLIEHVLERLAELRHRDIRSWTLHGANRARHFYRKSGFRDSGRRREWDHGDGRPVLELEYVRSVRHLRH